MSVSTEDGNLGESVSLGVWGDPLFPEGAGIAPG